MKQYPSITKQTQNIFVYAFDKLDGSNVRAEWDRKRGFTKFGSRHHLIDRSDLLLGKSVDLILNKYSEELSKVFKQERFERVVAFFEYYGPSSFAGRHKEDEEHQVTLFDLDVFKKGLLSPKEYLKLVGNLDIAKVLYHGPMNDGLASQVRDGTLEGMTFEGVVCKSNETDKYKAPLYFKIKNQAWLQKLKTYCNGDEKMFEELS